jgi:hypothetical protein
MRFHASLALPLLAATALPACLSDDADPVDADPPVVTTGTYRHYVQRAWALPATSADALQFGFDFDGDRLVDNQAGAVIGALAGLGLDVQIASDRALSSGSVVILHSVRADDLARDATVDWRVFTGEPLVTPPRWDGEDVFTVAGEEGWFVGPIVDRVARSEWGFVNLPLPFFPDQPALPLPLSAARVDASITTTGCNGTMGGLILRADLRATLDRFARQAITHIERNAEHEFSRIAYEVFDQNEDGVIAIEEMAGSGLAESLFTPDVDSDGDGEVDAISFGLGFTCEDARFTVASER